MSRYVPIELGQYNPLIEESYRDGIQESLDGLTVAAKLMGYNFNIEKDETGFGSRAQKKLSVNIKFDSSKIIRFSFVYLNKSIYIDHTSLVYEMSFGFLEAKLLIGSSGNKKFKGNSIEEQLRSILKFL